MVHFIAQLGRNRTPSEHRLVLNLACRDFCLLKHLTVLEREHELALHPGLDLSLKIFAHQLLTTFTDFEFELENPSRCCVVVALKRKLFIYAEELVVESIDIRLDGKRWFVEKIFCLVFIAFEVDIVFCARSSFQFLAHWVEPVSIFVHLTPHVEHGDELPIARIGLDHRI